MKKNKPIQVNDYLVQKVFEFCFKDQNIQFKECLLYDDYDTALIYAYHNEEEIKPKHFNFSMFNYRKQSNVIAYQIKFNDLIDHEKTI
jgi:hypothetical protein